ncbi:exonuclease domain-containing protein [Streptomyces sp. HK10]|uniref:exonuclease domain-containing protein n=1 Tax=Streptomyces sp. HK10 TaxID=3373255 RepID=UPI003748F70C
MDTSTWPRLLVVDVEGNGATPPDLVEAAVLPVVDGRLDTGTAGHWSSARPPGSPRRSRPRPDRPNPFGRCPPWQPSPTGTDLLGGAWICAHNAHVDHGVLTRHLPGWAPAGVLDTLRLARATYPALPSHSLDALIEHERLDLAGAPAQRHRATFDAYATALLLLALARHYPTWDAMAAVAVPPGLPGEPQREQEPTLW